MLPKAMPKDQMGAGIAAGPHCRRCWHSGFPAPELTASIRRSLPFGSRSFERPALSNGPLFRAVHLRSASPSGRSREAGSSHLALHSVLRRPQFLTAWAWQSLAPVPHSPRCRASCCCKRVSFPFPRAPLPQVRPRGLSFGRYLPRGDKGPSARCGVLPLASASAGCCLRSCNHPPCRISFASGRHSGLRSRSFRSAIGLFQSAPQHAGTGFNTYFPVQPELKILPFNQCLAALFSGFVSLSTRLMLRLGSESHKQQNAKLSTGSALAGGQLRKLRNQRCFSFVTIRRVAYYPRCASRRRRA